MLLVKVSTAVYGFLFVLLSVSSAVAQVSGACSSCHTMHNSQNDSAVYDSGPAVNLLKNDCVGCHSDSGSGSTLEVGSIVIPIVFNHAEPANPLAGGNFYWVAQEGGDAYGHNVLGISGPDSQLTRAPGINSGCSNSCHTSLAQPATMSYYPVDGIQNGCPGCHVPRHHADDSKTVADGDGGWYRFLAISPFKKLRYFAEENGVVGIESENWEEHTSSGSHNVYQGTTDIYDNGMSGYIYGNSIGAFCTGCHGNFHDRMNDAQSNFSNSIAGTWIRHPSDVLIPDTGEYSGYGTYDPLVPVARDNVVEGDQNFTTIDHTRDVVTCLSCHRAHGSPYPDMLRWDYSACNSLSENKAQCGCFTCHTTKDGI